MNLWKHRVMIMARIMVEEGTWEEMIRVANILFLILILCAPAGIMAQSDSVPPGTIQVRRPPIPADYAVNIRYVYSSKRRMFKPVIAGRGLIKRQIEPLISVGDITPPQPVSVFYRNGERTSPQQDSAKMSSFKEAGDRPADYNWVQWLEQCNYTFSWQDSSKLDSARFVYEIDRKGEVKFTPQPYAEADSNGVKFQRSLEPSMRRLWIWYPALLVNPDNGKQKRIYCTATVTVYAMEQKEPEPLPVVK